MSNRRVQVREMFMDDGNVWCVELLDDDSIVCIDSYCDSRRQAMRRAKYYVRHGLKVKRGNSGRFAPRVPQVIQVGRWDYSHASDE